LKRVGLSDYAKASVDGFEGRNKIAMIIGDGAIVRGGSTPNPLEEDEQMTVAKMTRLFRDVAEDTSIKGVILRVDSPGGDAVAFAHQQLLQHATVERLDHLHPAAGDHRARRADMHLRGDVSAGLQPR